MIDTEKQHTVTGWWFGTCSISHTLGILIPTDFHIFQRDGSTTNQIKRTALKKNVGNQNDNGWESKLHPDGSFENVGIPW